MANEIQVTAEAGLNLYFQIRNASGQVWYVSGETFETYGTGSRDSDDYDVALTDKSVGLYVGDFDANILTEGEYIIIVYKRLGANPADTDLVLGSQVLLWTGVSEFDPIVSHKAAYRAVCKSVQNRSDGTVDVYDTDNSTGLWTFTWTTVTATVTRTIAAYTP